MRKFVIVLAVFVFFASTICEAKSGKSNTKSKATAEQVTNQDQKQTVTSSSSKTKRTRRSTKQSDEVEYGKASYYTSREHKHTASGERFDDSEMTAAHKTLPFNTMVRVTNLKTQRWVDARINNRGPYVPGRPIDLSKGAFSQIAPLSQGVVRVKVERIK